MERDIKEQIERAAIAQSIKSVITPDNLSVLPESELRALYASIRRALESLPNCMLVEAQTI